MMGRPDRVRAAVRVPGRPVRAAADRRARTPHRTPARRVIQRHRNRNPHALRLVRTRIRGAAADSPRRPRRARHQRKRRPDARCMNLRDRPLCNQAGRRTFPRKLETRTRPRLPRVRMPQLCRSGKEHNPKRRQAKKVGILLFRHRSRQRRPGAPTSRPRMPRPAAPRSPVGRQVMPVDGAASV